MVIFKTIETVFILDIIELINKERRLGYERKF